MEERYLLLDQLLSNNNYATVERECTVELCNKGSNDDKDEWEIIRSHSPGEQSCRRSDDLSV